MSRHWHRIRRLIGHTILHADDTPHSIALGASLAMFIAILPLIGIQTLAAVTLAALLRVNKAICVPVVWVSNPLTMVPLYGACLAVGRLVLGTGGPEEPTEVLAHVAEPVQTASWVELPFWINLFRNLVSMGTDLWVGSTIVGLVLALATYPLTRWLVTTHRERHRRHLLQKRVFRVPLPTANAGPKSEVA